jgi:short-subunit dehydrogenase
LLSRQEKKFNVVVITGAARGIGKQIALQISQECRFLFLLDKDGGAELSELELLCSKRGAKTSYALVDVRNRDHLQKVITLQLGEFKEVDLVIANAGISPSLRGTTSYQENLSLMDTNFFGVVNTFECFSLPSSPSSKPNAQKLVAISSIASLIATQNSGFYSASKVALSRYLDSLRLLNLNSTLQVHEIICGFVDTRVNYGLAHTKHLAISDVLAAKTILRAIDKKRKHVHSIPRWQNFPWIALQFLPRRGKDRVLHFLYQILYGDKSI